jgi:hypothetical protein
MKLLLRALLLTLFTITLTSVNVFSQTATIVTDQPDYAPLSQAVFTGSGFQANESVTLKVKNMTQPCNTVSADSSYLPWTVTTDGAGGFVTNWTVCNCAGDSLKLIAKGQTSGLVAIVKFSDAGSYSYSPTSGSITMVAGTTDNTSINFDLTADKNNDNFSATLTFANVGGTIGIGTGTNQINLTSISNTFVTGDSHGSADTKNYPITVSIGSAVPNGTYAFKATPTSTGGPSGNSFWSFTVIVGSGSTSGSIQSVSVGSQSSSVVYGSNSSTTYDVTSLRDGNGTINGTYSVSGLPGVVTSSFSLINFNSTGSNTFPNSTLTLNNTATLAAGSYNFTVSLSDGTNEATTIGTLVVGKASSTTTVTITGAPFTYTGSAITPASVSVTGAGGLSLTPDPVYSNNINAGTANASYSYAGDANHEASSDSKDFTIDKAASVTTVTITGSPFTYTGSAITPASVSVTGAGGLSLTPDPVYSNNINAGTANASYSYAGDANHEASSDSKDFTIDKAASTISVIPYSVTYDGNPHTATYIIAGVNGESDATVGTITVSGTTHTDAGAYNDSWTFTGAANYNNASGNVTDVITARPITITPNASQFKYCGQTDPIFAYASSEPLISGNSFSGSLSRTGDANSGVGSYSYTLGTLSAGNNYTLALGGSNLFEIKGVLIDASASSVAIQINTSTTDLKATITNSTGDPVDAASVTFTVTNSTGNVLASGSSNTNVSGIATLPVNISGFPIGLYKVVAVAGSGCSSSTAYMTIYDPNGNFITGGGWIMSPEGALVNKPSVTGKANFGFNAKYKKGNNLVDGNTEFQFQQGDFNFKSSSLDAGTLVISGAKATYRGVGTVNGAGNYGFMVSAVDGQINGGGGTDLFRIKIWDRSQGNTVIYDNNMGNDENGVPTTALGGGSIVIHNANGKQSRIMAPTVTAVNDNKPTDQAGTGTLTVKVMPNPTSYYFTVALQSLSKEKVKLMVTDITGRVIEQRTNVSANSTIQLGNQYHPGIYIAQFQQGTDKVTVRLIKEGK